MKQYLSKFHKQQNSSLCREQFPAKMIAKLWYYQGGKFLEKLLCSVGGRVLWDNLVLSTELISQFGHQADLLNISPLSEPSMTKNKVLC